jgi:MFS family permease
MAWSPIASAGARAARRAYAVSRRHGALRVGLVAAGADCQSHARGEGGCARMVLGRAIVRNVYDRERSARALATIMMVMSLAPWLSPAIGAYLAQWVGWRVDFVLLGAVGATVRLELPPTR